MTDDISTNAIHMMPDNKVVMRIERDRIWVDPDVEVDETAQKVIKILEYHIVNMVEKDREKMAQTVERMGALGYGTLTIAAAIRSGREMTDPLPTSSPAALRRQANRPWDDKASY